jgi:hypothetical protein
VKTNEDSNKLKQFFGKYKHRLKALNVNFRRNEKSLSMDLFTPIAKCNRLNRFSFSYDNRGYLEYDFSAIEKFMKLMAQNCKELKILIFK